MNRISKYDFIIEISNTESYLRQEALNKAYNQLIKMYGEKIAREAIEEIARQVNSNFTIIR